MALENIIKTIIKDSFPELMNEDIQIEWKDLKDALMEYGGLSVDGFYIEVDKSLKKANKKVLIGGIAHELCHILEDIKLGKEKSLRSRIAYKISRRYKTLDERNTDLQVIIRGYGKELLEFMKFSIENGYDYYKEDGLSAMEIEAIIKAYPT